MDYRGLLAGSVADGYARPKKARLERRLQIVAIVADMHQSTSILSLSGLVCCSGSLLHQMILPLTPALVMSRSVPESTNILIIRVRCYI